MWKLAILSTLVAVTPVAAQQPPSSEARIEVTQSDGSVRRFTDSEIRLCDARPGASAMIEIHLRDRRTKVTLHNVRLCAPREESQLTFSATQCVISGGVINITLVQSCRWE